MSEDNTSKVGLIWAQNADGVIGLGDTIPWHIPEDLKHFNEITMGSTLIMGRSTWLSLPEKFRPLPGRRNLVLSSNLEFDAPGAEVFSSLETAFSSATTEWVWVIGGSRVYKESLLFADRLEVTQVDLPWVVGDTFAPPIPYAFKRSSSGLKDGEWLTSKNDLQYRFESYTR